MGLYYVYRSDTDEDELRKLFDEHGTVVNFKFFEYVFVRDGVH